MGGTTNKKGGGGGGKRIDFIVNTGDPSDAANKKRVRSVAALKSWPERRRKLFEQLEGSSTSGQGAFLVEEPRRKVSRTEASSTATRVTRVAGPPRPGEEVVTTATTVTEPSHRQPTTLSQGVSLYHDALSRVPATTKAIEQVHAVHRDSPCSCPQCRHKRKVANICLEPLSTSTYSVPARRKRMADGSEKPMGFNGDMALITPPSSPESAVSGGRTDPFNCYPVPYQSWFDKVLHHSESFFSFSRWSWQCLLRAP